jgi:hypothetical protein
MLPIFEVKNQMLAENHGLYFIEFFLKRAVLNKVSAACMLVPTVRLFPVILSVVST